ncbi:MAG: hypothetical protein FWF82_03905 [Oscillospiraceae bacterium]|nr:hypothetical protein [Oscillospiraceae bacterium]
MRNNEMSQVKISHFQLASALAVSVMFSLTCALPNIGLYSMGRYLTIPIAVAAVLALYTPLMMSASKGESSGFTAIDNSFMKWTFGSLILIRLLFAGYLTLVQLAYRITRTAMPYISPFYFAIIIFLVAGYGMLKGLQSSARVAPIALVLYVLLIITVSFSMWYKFDFTRIHSPLLSSGVVGNTFSEVIRNDEIFMFAVLCGFVRGKQEQSQDTAHKKGLAQKSVLLYLPLVLVAGMWLNTLFHGVLGRFVNSVECQMYTISSFSKFNIVERMDGIFVTIIIICGILKMVLSFVCIRAVLSHLLCKSDKSNVPDKSDKPDKSERTGKIVASVLLAGISVLSFFTRGNIEWFEGLILDIVLAVLLVSIALVMPITDLIVKNKSRRQTA